MIDIIEKLIVPIAAAIITSLVTFYVAMQNRNQFFSNIVSRERMAWIKEVRACCIQLCSICEQYEDQKDMPEEQYRAFLEARNGILIHLDPKGAFQTDDDLIEMINKDFKTVKDHISEIRSILTRIIKLEWDVVKQEAGHSPRIAKKIKEMRRKEQDKYQKAAQQDKYQKADQTEG